MNCLDVMTKTAALSKNGGKFRFYDFYELWLRLWFWERLKSYSKPQITNDKQVYFESSKGVRAERLAAVLMFGCRKIKQFRVGERRLIVIKFF